jgi:hypothetical protein
MTRHRRSATLLAAGTVLLGACTSGSESVRTNAGASPNGAVQVINANYELVADESNRVLIGLVLPDNRFVAYGSVQMRFARLDDAGQQVGATSQVVTGTYLAVPGTDEGDPAAEPQATTPATARGVYELEGVRFGEPGTWVVEVAARVQGVGTVQGATQIEVLEGSRVPGVGEKAPRSDNAIIGDPGVDASAIDSRATDNGSIPDPELHRISIADAIRDKRFAVVVFSTPVYCVSRFCGPVTDMIQTVAKDYGGLADFIHVEVWEDFEAKVPNATAATWLDHEGTFNEPWLFVIGPDGKIVARWDNLFTAAEVTASLDDVIRIP